MLHHLRPLRPAARPAVPVVTGMLAVVLATVLAGPAAAAERADVVVRFKHGTSAAERTQVLRAAGARRSFRGPGGALIARLGTGGDTARAAAALRHRRAVAWASPALRARVADFVPNDPGTAARTASDGGWELRQWDFAGPFGVRAPEAWDIARAAGGDGGRGVTVAVLDTGVAYADRGPFRRSPDLPASRMIRGRDFVAGDDYPNDANGHGTFVASEIAAAANNHYGMVGLAYASKILAVRVLDEYGEGSSYRVAEGIRYAVNHGAQVINVSIELSNGVRSVSLTSAPEIRAALQDARRHHVTVVAASGNSADTEVPAAKYGALSIQVGGTTEHGCAADYSNSGPGLDLMAPGGGDDAPLLDDPHCRPEDPRGRTIRQITFRKSDPGRFLVPGDYEGTSMAAPHVTATIALLLAAHTLGDDPTPDAIQRRLKSTAYDLGAPGTDGEYGAGLLDAAAALGAPPRDPLTPATP